MYDVTAEPLSALTTVELIFIVIGFVAVAAVSADSASGVATRVGASIGVTVELADLPVVLSASFNTARTETETDFVATPTGRVKYWLENVVDDVWAALSDT